jgi:hypothetical protein
MNTTCKSFTSNVRRLALALQAMGDNLLLQSTEGKFLRQHKALAYHASRTLHKVLVRARVVRTPGLSSARTRQRSTSPSGGPSDLRTLSRTAHWRRLVTQQALKISLLLCFYINTVETFWVVKCSKAFFLLNLGLVKVGLRVNSQQMPTHITNKIPYTLLWIISLLNWVKFSEVELFYHSRKSRNWFLRS